MQTDEFIQKVKKSLSSNECIVFFCNCEIKYTGRAEAHLSPGDRIIIIKSDNTLLVHQPNGSVPVNYMKEGSSIEIGKKENRAFIKSYNQKYKDSLLIEIYLIHSFISQRLEDGQKIHLEGSEKDMSDMIYDNPTLISKDFKPLAREEHTKYGFIDVFGYNKNGELVVVECKRYTAGPDAVTQLRRYVEKIKSLRGIKTVHGIIASPKISPNALKMAEDWGFKFVSVNPPKRLETYKKSQKGLNEY
jgi:hypothetical protein